MLKLAKNQAKAKQHSELSLFEKYSHFSSMLSFNNNRKYFEKCPKRQVGLFL